MLDTISRWLFDPTGLTPHGFCLLWEPGLIWLHALSDVAVGVAYLTIPAALYVFIRKRRDLVFRPVFLLFAAFIFLCGTGHFLDVLTLWVPAYGIEGVWKLATAVVSVFTAIALWRLLPQALALPSPAQMREADAALRASEDRLRQSQKMEAIGRLTGGVAHDINNVLQAISGCTALIERHAANGRTQDVLRLAGTARQSVARAAALTQRMLAFARRQSLRPSAVDPVRLVEGVGELVRRTVGPSIRVIVAPHPGASRPGAWRALCDANQLENALLNLAINGRDAMPDGGLLTIGTAERALARSDMPGDEETEAGDYVEFSVTDEGTGMTADVLARAFEPFFTTKPAGQGTGLGLSQTYGFARQSGGFVRIESAPGRGTTVRLLVPRADAAAERAEDDAAPPGPAAGGAAPREDIPGGAKVLLVEDEANVREQVATVLRERGCTVLEAADGPSGLALMRTQERLDMLVTDIGLPGMNGRQLAEATRQLHPRIPVLLITGYADTALQDLAPTEGMEVLAKPFDLDRLTAHVATAIGGARVA